MRRLLYVIGFCTILCNLTAQPVSPGEIVRGIVTDRAGKPIEGVFLRVESTPVGAVTDKEGSFQLELPIHQSEYKIAVTHVGYQRLYFVGDRSKLVESLSRVMLEDSAMGLSDVVVRSKTEERKLKDSGYAVSVVDLTPYHGSAMELSGILEKVSGVKVLQEGGVGSDVKIALNGFAGNHVRIFIDGMPIEGVGPSFQLNNLPVQLAEKVEVYKGVLPGELATDALGGAINIVTHRERKRFLDLSAAYGSFNTKKIYLNAGRTLKNGLLFRLNVFRNDADNDYRVNARILDFETNTYSQNTRSVRRFHDRFTNQSGILHVGVQNKRFADQLLVGFTAGELYDEIQHAADMDKVFGYKWRKSRTFAPSLSYRKSDLLVKNLHLTAASNLNLVVTNNIDTSRYVFNWLGQSKERSSPGEQRHSLYRYQNRNATVSGSLSYQVGEKQAVAIHTNAAFFKRSGHDEFRPFFSSLPTSTSKTITALTYRFTGDKLDLNSFYKRYDNSIHAFYERRNKEPLGVFHYRRADHGVGAVVSYPVLTILRLKASFERAVRLPSSRELFGVGDGVEEQNTELRPEKSINFNFTTSLTKVIDRESRVEINANYAFRNASDFIHRRNRNGVFRTENFGAVRVNSFDVDMRYTYREKITLTSAFTYQEIRNKQRFIVEDGLVRSDYFYNERLPNIPYLFGNLGLDLSQNRLFLQQDKGTFRLAAAYSNSFVNDWDVYVSSQEVPRQLVVDALVSYSLKEGRYAVFLECTNLLNTNRYDYYNIQKPGRGLSIKFRYFVN